MDRPEEQKNSIIEDAIKGILMIKKDTDIVLVVVVIVVVLVVVIVVEVVV